ncbi:unnamed protein product [Victoria cruziana]
MSLMDLKTGSNLLSSRQRSSNLFLNSKLARSLSRKLCRTECSAKKVGNPESNGSEKCIDTVLIGGEEGPAITRFKMSDFSLCDRVSIGLAGRGDEVIFEAIVRVPDSPLYKSKVVLRQLTTSQAQRRGRRALEVLKKLARRHLMYHSYAMQVHGYVSPSNGADHGSFVLVHGYHGSYSLQHWLQLANWLPTLEATLALDEECARRVGDGTIGGPAVTRQLRLIRILMRDLLIGVNYLHSHGLAHTELRLENVHVSPVDRHVKVGILGNAADFDDGNPTENTPEGNTERRRMMIAFDMRCVGFMMAKMVLRELMDPSIFMKFKSFLTKGNDPSCLREFLVPILNNSSPSGNSGLQILDRNWGAGWNLLSLMLAAKPSERISCLDALRHPFLCGPKWRVDPSVDIIKWGLGSTAVRITEEYIYGRHQRSRLAYFIELMEKLNPYPELKNWNEFLPGKWRLLYSTGRHVGLTLRQPSPSVLIGNAHLTFNPLSDNFLSIQSNVDFTVISAAQWPHNKVGSAGRLQITCKCKVAEGNWIYGSDEMDDRSSLILSTSQGTSARKPTNRTWRRISPVEDIPQELPVVSLLPGEIEVTMNLDEVPQNVEGMKKVLHEVRVQIPPEMFDVSKLVCATYADSRLLVLRSVAGAALLFTRTPA